MVFFSFFSCSFLFDFICFCTIKKINLNLILFLKNKTTKQQKKKNNLSLNNCQLTKCLITLTKSTKTKQTTQNV